MLDPQKKSSGRCLRQRIADVKTLLVFAVIAAPALVIENVEAQEAIPAPEAIAPTPSDEGDAAGMYETLQQLRKQRQAVMADVQSANQATANQDSSRVRANRDILELRRQLNYGSSTSAKQTQRIRSKLDRLRQLVDDGAFCPADQSGAVTPNANSNASKPDETAPVSTPAAQQPPNDNTEGDKPPAEPPASGNNKPPVNMRQMTADAVDAIGRPVKAVEPTPSLPDAVIKALSIVDGPVDSLRFANNLYGSEEYQLALEIYQKIDRSKLTPNQKVWIEYQLANCYRRVGNTPMAERSYRIVLSSDRDGWIGKNSRWWLEIGGQSAALEQKVSAMGQNIEQLSNKEQADAKQ